jgi:Spy/CpxP family protein refolding chaperone
MAAQPWWTNRLEVSSLNLSEDQTKQLNAIQNSYVSRLRELYDSVNKAERNLDDVFNDATLDEIKADAAVDQYANARDNLTRALSQLSLKMRAVLTAEQWQQLVARRNARGGRGRGRRGPPPLGSGVP